MLGRDNLTHISSCWVLLATLVTLSNRTTSLAARWILPAPTQLSWTLHRDNYAKAIADCPSSWRGSARADGNLETICIRPADILGFDKLLGSWNIFYLGQRGSTSWQSSREPVWLLLRDQAGLKTSMTVTGAEEQDYDWWKQVSLIGQNALLRFF